MRETIGEVLKSLALVVTQDLCEIRLGWILTQRAQYVDDHRVGPVLSATGRVVLGLMPSDLEHPCGFLISLFQKALAPDREAFMDTEKLKILIQIADSGSVQAAAHHLGLTRSSLRRCVDTLEADFGTLLIHRGPTGVQLTTAGALLVERGRFILDDTRTLQDDVRAAGREATGTLRIFEPVGMPLKLRIHGLMAVRLALPNQRVEIRQVENPLTHIREPFEMMLHEGTPSDRSDWFTRVLMKVPLRLAASRSYLNKRGRPQAVADLAGHDTLGWVRPGQRANEWPLLDCGTVVVSPWTVSADPTLLDALARAGGGIFPAPQAPLFDDPAIEPLEVVLAEQVGAELVFRVTTPFPSRADPRTHDTLKIIQEHLSGLPKD